MKVTISPDGAIELDVETGNGQVAEAAALVRELRAQAQAELAQAEAETAKAVEADHHTMAAIATLTDKQRTLLSVLADMDQPEGCHVSGLADLLDTTNGAVSHMVTQVLMSRGLVHRVSRGHYQATGSAILALRHH